MNKKTALAIQELNDRFRQVCSLMEEKEAEAAIEKCEEALASPEMVLAGDPANAAIHFIYMKAAALDNSGRCMEAFPLFEKLVTEYPGTPEFESSILTVCGNLAEFARRLISDSPRDPRIPQILEMVSRHTIPPYWLVFPVVAEEIARGKVREGFQRMMDILALSPNDADYLKCAMSLAKSEGLEKERLKLVSHVKTLLEEKPYRLDLAVVLKEEDGSPAAMSS
jgi:tetratricopeptide (TPR) repeat protein